MDGILPLLHTSVGTDGQPRPGLQVHAVPREEEGGPRTEEFNKQFYETVERGVFKEISREEMKKWEGPVNYITMVEAFKEGPHSTTPLRICMNSPDSPSQCRWR